MWNGKRLSLESVRLDKSLSPEAKRFLGHTYHLINNGDFNSYVIEETSETLQDVLRYLSENNWQQNRQEIIQKELEYRESGNAGYIDHKTNNFCTYTGRYFVDEWNDVRKAVYLIRHPVKQPRMMIRFYFTPRKRVR